MIQFSAPSPKAPQGLSGTYLGSKNKADDPFSTFLDRCKNDIYFYFKRIGFKPTWQQKQYVDALVAGESNVAVRSGKGPGKTSVTGACLPWWSMTRVQSRVVVTAPTMRQCKDIWLAEAEKWVMSDKLLRAVFKFTNTGYGVLGHKQNQWGCFLATATTPEAFQGIHNPNLLIYCEEASGINRAIMQAIQDTMSGHKGNNLWHCVGNPNTRTCRFFDFFHSLAGNPWIDLHWNAEETPISSWFSGERNAEIAEEFGIDSDVYRVAVKGEFPSSDPDSLLSETDVDVCFTQAGLAGAIAAKDTEKQIGLDFARFGGDSNVSVIRHGGVLLELKAMTRVDPIQLVEYAVMKQDHYGWKNDECMYVPDTSGMGESVVGILGAKRRMGKRLHEFYSQNTAHESQKYANKITEAWCTFAKRVRKGEIYLGEVKHRKLILQLTNRKYGIDKDGRIKIETKDEYKKRNSDNEQGGELGKSPDEADAVVMAFYPYAHISQRVCIAD